jgi:hypothetical protein
MNVSVTGVGVGDRANMTLFHACPIRQAPLQMNRSAHHSATLEMRQHDG